ncbi:hypothetical protein BJX96DRAFT_170579 [Aspergillus floccosus]
MGLLRTWLLLAITPGLAWSTAFNRVTEVDLIFPLNETFSPSPLIPIVFAIQDPSLLSSLRPTLRYRDLQLNVIPLDRFRRGDVIRLFEHNLTDVADPYLLYLSIDLAYYFSTKHGVSPPDLVAFAKKETCNRTFAQAVHVPSALELPPTSTATWGGPSCAVSPDLSPTPTPCNVKLDASAAASIFTSLTVDSCNERFRTGVSCPTPSSENAASMPQFPVTRAWLSAIGTLLAYSLA